MLTGIFLPQTRKCIVTNRTARTGSCAEWPRFFHHLNNFFMKNSNVSPAVGRQRQTIGLETILLWIIIAIGVVGVAVLYSGTDDRDTTALAAGASSEAPAAPVARIGNP
jgi:hypothetical protein